VEKLPEVTGEAGTSRMNQSLTYPGIVVLSRFAPFHPAFDLASSHLGRGRSLSERKWI
jgi:hypothetical protein